MAAIVTHTFERAFRLDEERLRRIDSIVRDGLKQIDPTWEHSFRVGRADALAYETAQVEDIVAEKNFESERLVRISVKADKESRSLRLDFDAREGCRLEIDGDDRNWVYVVSSTLRQFLESDVCVGFRRRLSDSRAVPLVFMLGTLVIMASTAFFATNRQARQEALESSEISDKLDYLIAQRTHLDDILPAALAILGLTFAVFIFGFDWIVKRLFPGNLFLFGRENDRYKRLIDIRSKVVWGVLIAFIVSALASVAVWFATTPAV